MIFRKHISGWVLLWACLLTGEVLGQDIHFSQFYSAPLTLNPAFTGLIGGDIRMAGNYRNQWAGIGRYNTYAAALDAKVLQRKICPSQLGLGLLLISDRSGTVGLNHFNGAISTAYQFSLAASGKANMSLGMQAGILQKSFQPEEAIYPNQVSAYGINTALPSGETAVATSISYLDLSAGALFYYSEADQYSLHAGGAIYHLNQPDESFLAGDNRYDLRQAYHAGAKFKAGKRIHLIPGMQLMQQSKAMMIIAGNNLEYSLSEHEETTLLFLGAWYRLQDAAIAYAGLQFDKYRFGLSYDITVSAVSNVRNGHNSVEVSFIYLNNFGPEIAEHCPKNKRGKKVNCPLM